ncbi:hypothetical protein B296_00032513 [Ensete ventricosum]|uniref:Uncharacterized protein n=1 Tax=Ensete ventricosum TaxID=4639 RepID=A0A426Y7X5_ENSVE|nr:hypothetical protein B296_00032513 [Ensete ventricosum]
MADAPRALIDDGSTFGGSIPGLCLRATNTRSAWWASPPVQSLPVSASLRSTTKQSTGSAATAYAYLLHG